MFEFGKNRFLGVDVGTSAIKIAEIEIKKNKPVLSNYAWMRMGTNEKDSRSISFDGTLPEYLKKIIKNGGFKSKNAYVSIPAFGGLITLIELPAMTKEDLDQAIRFEAHKYIPTSLEDVVLSWDIVGKKNEKSKITAKSSEDGQEKKTDNLDGKVQALLVAAPKNTVLKYEKLINAAKLELKNMEIESFSMVRSLVGSDPGNFLIVDIGSKVCNIILAEKGMVKVSRSIDAGGRDITKIISRGMNMEEESAERLKISKRDFLNKESGIQFPVLDIIIGEIKRILNAYCRSGENFNVDRLILSGGTAGLDGIEQYFSEALKIKTVVGNPFGRVEYKKELARKLDSIKGQFSVCVGLALKGAEDLAKK